MLGPVPAEVVVAALGFFEPAVVAQLGGGPGVRSLAETVRLYAEACHPWGRHRFGALDGVERLADLLDAVAERADPAGLPLFAGWRPCRCPTTPRPGRPSCCTCCASTAAGRT